MPPAVAELAQMLVAPSGWKADAWKLVMSVSPASAIRLLVEDRRRRHRHIGPGDIEEMLRHSRAEELLRALLLEVYGINWPSKPVRQDIPTTQFWLRVGVFREKEWLPRLLAYRDSDYPTTAEHGFLMLTFDLCTGETIGKNAGGRMVSDLLASICLDVVEDDPRRAMLLVLIQESLWFAFQTKRPLDRMGASAVKADAHAHDLGIPVNSRLVLWRNGYAQSGNYTLSLGVHQEIQQPLKARVGSRALLTFLRAVNAQDGEAEAIQVGLVKERGWVQGLAKKVDGKRCFGGIDVRLPHDWLSQSRSFGGPVLFPNGSKAGWVFLFSEPKPCGSQGPTKVWGLRVTRTKARVGYFLIQPGEPYSLEWSDRVRMGNE